MSTINAGCPYCSARQAVDDHGDYRPFYVKCADCSRRFIVEPVRSGAVVYRDGEAPCCSDPECRATEMGASGDE